MMAPNESTLSGRNEEQAINTIYIMSKGRPECSTAKTLKDLKYPGEWFIVCGDNDETVPEYIERWGKERIIVFDWRLYAEKCELLDNFGLEDLPSGAVPARNAIKDISAQREERRHWQFDDDFSCFKICDNNTKKMVKVEDGHVLERALYAIAAFADKCNLANAGFDTASFARWNTAKQTTLQVFCAHNLPSGEDFIPWRGRVGDDIINLCDTFRRGCFEIAFRFLTYTYVTSGTKKGGNTDLYNGDGSLVVKRVSYEVLVAPTVARFVWDPLSNTYRPRNAYSSIIPKIIREEYSRGL